jgi:predicted nucleic acid-binding Zn ribbon protein
MEKNFNINNLLDRGGERLSSLKAQSRARAQALARVMAALPPRIAAHVTTAGIEHGRLTIGVSGSAWASRLRYMTEMLRRNVGEAMGTEIRTVRIKVVRPVEPVPRS